MACVRSFGRRYGFKILLKYGSLKISSGNTAQTVLPSFLLLNNTKFYEVFHNGPKIWLWKSVWLFFLVIETIWSQNSYAQFIFSLRQHEARQERECEGYIRLVFHTLDLFLLVMGEVSIIFTVIDIFLSIPWFFVLLEKSRVLLRKT